MRAGPRAKSRGDAAKAPCAGQGASWPCCLPARLRWAQYLLRALAVPPPLQTFVGAQGAAVALTATVDGEPESLMIYQGISQTGGQLRVQDARGREVLLAQLTPGGCFAWARHALSGTGPYTVTVTGAQVFELAFTGADGTALPVHSSTGAALFDEQGLVPARPGYENSMYFDEIYHARTAYETVHGLPVYETTHPPLGKDIMALGVALFGMTPFGWRCMGALFGVLLAPGFIFWRARCAAAAARPRWPPFFGALISCALRKAASAPSTPTPYFFILASALGMLGFCGELARAGFTRRGWACLAASGAAFGCGAAVKWTGIFAGAGLAALYFWALGARAKAPWRPARRQGARCAGCGGRALAGGMALFVLLPLAIYLASYLPLGLGTPQYSLADWWAAQQSMYAYHSALNATHPFESRWFTWPFDVRPVWYYMGGELPQGMAASIACLGSPLVFWGGTAALAGWRGSRCTEAAPCRARCAGAVGRPNHPLDNSKPLHLSVSLLSWRKLPACWRWQCFGQAGTPAPRRGAALALAVCAGLLFAMFYPTLSGLPVPEGYARLLLWFPKWQFYSL